MTELKDKNIAILGWGLDSQDLVPYLISQGAKLSVFDRKNEVEGQEKYPEVVWSLGSEKFPSLTGFDLIIRSPGVYRYRPEIIEAEKAGVEISSKIKLFFDLCPGKIIGITGTKGKGTTSTLVYEILKAAGKEAYLGGNIGAGIFNWQLTPQSLVVLELSSFQLIDLEKSPHIAVVLMVTSEHLDWHKNTSDYIEAKKNIVSHQLPSDFAVVNKDYPNSVEIAQTATGQVVWISKNDTNNFHNKDIGLRGDHNRENIAAALAVTKLIGISEEISRKAIKDFKGLEHRLEEVGIVKGVTFFNDSFSTVPETAIAAIKSFNEPEVVILGGSRKNSDFTELTKTIQESKNIKAVVLVGQEGERLKEMLKGVNILEGGKTMPEIVKTAFNAASPGDVILLSPACASFDLFKNYKDRGQQFKQEVNKLKLAI